MPLSPVYCIVVADALFVTCLFCLLLLSFFQCFTFFVGPFVMAGLAQDISSGSSRSKNGDDSLPVRYPPPYDVTKYIRMIF